jgi:hypothetical protein
MATPRKSTERRTSAESTSQRSTAKGNSQRSTAKNTSQRSTAKNTSQRSTPPKRKTPARAAENVPDGAPKSLRTIAVAAARELAQLIGQVPEGIVGVEKHDDGWQVRVEVVESRRIPETTDILAVYEVDVDNDGAVTGYRRTDRYVRGRIQD